MNRAVTWPEIPALEESQDTLATVHMFMQIVGKIRLELSPWVNHSWGSALYVTTRGITTSPIPYRDRCFAIDFDFVNHALYISVSNGNQRSFDLHPMMVADFYHKIMSSLGELKIDVDIFSRPVEVEQSIPFEQDTEHDCYDADAVHRYWMALVQANRILAGFRGRFIGKVSPVHFFWGAFDLAVTRFSGRTAPKHPGGAPNCADWVMEEAYSHELSSAGFWPGVGLGEAAFYAYAYPTPKGFSEYSVEPAAAYYHSDLGEFVLPYEAVRTADDPDQTVRRFLETTYEAAATLGNWGRETLEAQSQHSAL